MLMEKKIITAEQIETLKGYEYCFTGIEREDGVKYYKLNTTAGQFLYFTFTGLDEATVRRLGSVDFNIEYYKDEDGKYVTRCETWIDGVFNLRMSMALESETDFMGCYTGKAEAPSLPENWDDLVTDDMLHDLLQKRNIQTIECLQDDVPDEMKERIAYDWIKDNPSEAYDTALDSMCDYDMKDAIKDAIDRL